MVIDNKLIEYLEELSRLELNNDEKKIIKKDLGDILDYVDTLNEIDTENIEGVSHPFTFTNAFREDEVINTDNREDILKNAPDKKDGAFKVPKTVE